MREKKRSSTCMLFFSFLELSYSTCVAIMRGEVFAYKHVRQGEKERENGEKDRKKR